MKRRRRFLPGECSHIYQRTVQGVNIFYDREDYLVFYMIISVSARKFKVKIIKMCLMIDHIHILVEADSCKEMADFVRHYTSVFVREYNDSIGRKGQLMHKSFGSAPKKGDKKTRSAIIYIGNNPVEKKICRSAEEYRWNFIAYLGKINPFSKAVPESCCSKMLRRAKREVSLSVAANCYINYARLRWFMRRIDDEEKEILTDYIVTEYMPFDLQTLWSYYEDEGQMIAAMNASTGSEYDIKEKVTHHSDLIYERIKDVVRKETGLDTVRKVTVLPEGEKVEMLSKIKDALPEAEYFQICKFLHVAKKKREL